MDKLPPEALEAGAALQWPIEKMPLVGGILLICTILYILFSYVLTGVAPYTDFVKSGK